MKICHMTSVHPAHDTRILLRECVALRRAGHDVILVAPADADELYDGVKISAVKKRSGRLSRMLFTTRDVYRKALAVDADAYHFHDPELMPAAWRLRLKGKKIIYDVHEDVPQQILLKRWLPLRGLVSRLYRLAERMFLGGVNVVSASEYIRRRYYAKKHAVTVANYPDLYFLKPHLKLQRSVNNFRVIYIGSVTLDRGVDTMLDAFAAVQKKYPDAWFDCVGPMDDATFDAVKQLASFRTVESRVAFHGALPLSDCYALAKEARVGLCVLKPTSTYKLAYPTKIFEYMAVGLPVVASDFDVVKEVVTGNRCGLCVYPLSAAAVADAILHVLDHPAEADAMGASGAAAAANRYSWEAESQKLIDFYGALR